MSAYLTDEDYRAAMLREAAQKQLPVNADGIPIPQNSELAAELGIGTPKVAGPADVSVNPTLGTDITNWLVKGPDKALAERAARGQVVGPPAPPPVAAPPPPPPATVETVPPVLARPLDATEPPRDLRETQQLAEAGDSSALPSPQLRDSDLALMGIARLGAMGAGQQAGDSKRINAAYDRMGAAATRQAQIDAARIAEEEPHRREMAQMAASLERRQAEAQQRAHQQTEEQISRIRQLEKEAANADALKGFWADKSAGQRVGWGISIGLGAFAKAASRGTITDNPAMDMFKMALAEDGQTKARQLAAKRDQITGERTILQDMRQGFADDQQALTANYVAGIGRIEAQIKAEAAKYGTQDVQAKADMLLANLDAERQKALSQEHARAFQQNLQVQQALTGVLMTREQMAAADARMRLRMAQKQLANEKEVTYRPSVRNFLPGQDPDSTKKLSEMAWNYYKLKDIGGQLSDLLAPKVNGVRQKPDASFEGWGPDKLAVLGQLNSMIDLLNIKVGERGSTLTDKETEFIEKLRGGGAYWQVLAPEKVGQLIDRLVRQAHNDTLSYAVATRQANPGEDRLDDEWMEKHPEVFTPGREQSPLFQRAAGGPG